MTNIALVLKEAAHSLNSVLEAELLLAWVLNKNRAYLLAHPEVLVNNKELTSYENLIAQRIKGIPIAYLTGTREFWSLDLKVNEHTLIPRHETELLVELVLELMPQNKDPLSLLDLGTGSGALALALATERPPWRIDACDKSQEALAVAQENASDYHIKNIHFYKSDWFNTLPNKQYHAIISNPPYIAESDPHLAQGDLRFEPRNALVSSQDGLADLQYIITNSKTYLSPGGLLLLEHGYDQKFSIRAIMNKLGYENIQTWQDLQGHDRVTGGYRAV